MDLLRNIGSAAVSSLVQKSGLNLPFSLGEKNLYFEGRTIWSLYDGTKRDDGSPVSIFMYDAHQHQNRNMLPLAKNALRKLRTVRHPDVVRFIDAVETDTTVYIMTERVQPLGKAMQASSSRGVTENEDWLVWGLHRISTSLAFVNDSCQSTHGNVRTDSIFLSPSGEWKLGGFELLSNSEDENAVLYNLGGTLSEASKYASPEVKKGGWSILKEHHPSVADAYALGLLIHSVFNPNLPLPVAEPPHPPPAPSKGSIPTYLYPSFKRLLTPNAKARLSPAAFLEIGMAQGGQGFFANNNYVRICTGLDQFSILGEVDKAGLLKTLKDSATSFPPEFASHRILPSLVSALEFGGASASTMLPLVLQLGNHVPSLDYPNIVLAPITKLYASPDRGTRMALLEHLDEYVDKLDNKLVAEKIWPNLQTGFTDTVPVIREATIKAIGSLYPKFNDRILNNDLLRHLAKMQMDPEASIRTNTCILIGRLAPALAHSTKKKVLVPALARALKDIFVHARVAGLMAFMATIDCYDAEDLATKVIPVVSPTLIDKEKLVRDQAFTALDLFVKKLQSHASSMPETMLNDRNQPNIPLPIPLPAGQATIVNSAAGAAGALAGWAMSSLTKKLMPGDLQSTMASAGNPTIERTPPIPSDSPPTFSSSSSLVSPNLAVTASQSYQVRPKALQLGGPKQSAMSKSAALAAELADEAETENNSNAWGGDLMDVNADEDDWSAFESAKATTSSASAAFGSVSPKPFSTVDLGFGDIQPPKTPEITIDDDDGWGSMDPTNDTKRSETNEWGGFGSTSEPRKSPVPITQPRPQRPQLHTMKSISPSPPPSNPKTPPPPSTVGMTKEDKAAEMARRKEERKLRIAQLKEAKKHSSGKS